MNILDESPVPILQSPWEFEQLVSMYQRLSPKNVVEIGSFYGGTLWFWIDKAEKHLESTINDDMTFKDSRFVFEELRSLTSVDYPIGLNDSRYGEMMYCRGLWRRWTKDIDFHDLQGDSHSPEMIQKVRELYPDNDVDFLFIDGDHSYGGVKADFDNYTPLVRSGGLIVLHDVCGLPEVSKFWQEIKPKYKAIEINEPGGWGIGIIEK